MSNNFLQFSPKILIHIPAFFLGLLLNQLLEGTGVLPNNPADTIQAIIVACAFVVLFNKFLDLYYRDERQNEEFCARSQLIGTLFDLAYLSTDFSFPSEEIHLRVETLYNRVLRPFNIPAPLRPSRPVALPSGKGNITLLEIALTGKNSQRETWLEFLRKLDFCVNNKKAGLKIARHIYPLMEYKREEEKKEVMERIRKEINN